MQWITIFLIGIAANLDNLGIGLAYGVKRVKIPILSNAAIAGIAMVITFVAVTAGETMIDYISVQVANYLGSLLLCIVGLWTIFSKKFSQNGIKDNPELFDEDKNFIISFREALMLGFVLSANCFVTGIAIGANGVPTIWTVISIGVFSFISIAAGSHFGILLTKTFIGKYSTTISGILLLIIGIFEMFVQ